MDTLHGMILIAAVPTASTSSTLAGPSRSPRSSDAYAGSKSAHHSYSPQPYLNR